MLRIARTRQQGRSNVMMRGVKGFDYFTLSVYISQLSFVSTTTCS